MARSDPHDQEFSGLYLSDFIIIHNRVARCKLECLALNPFLSSLVSWGVQPHIDHMEPLDLVLEASIGCSSVIGVVLLDKVASINEKVDIVSLDMERLRDARMEDMEEVRRLEV